MFSKATLIGVVGIEPNYRASADGKDSVIAFRIGCEVFTNSKKITEWYTIKAFGRVADYLHQNIKKDSSVFLEASIRNKRWTVDGVERQGIEFHAFTARAMSDADNNQNAHPGTSSSTATDTSDMLSAPQEEKTVIPEVNPPKLPPKPLTAEESRQVASRFRQTLEAHKKRIAELAQVDLVADNVTTPEKVSETSLAASANVRPPFTNHCPTPSVKELPLTGNSKTDKLLNARKALSRSGEKVISNQNGYAHVRGGWSNIQ